MSKLTNDIAVNALQIARRSIDQETRNLAAPAGSSAKSLVTESIVVNGQLMGLTTKTERHVDEFALKAIRDHASQASYYHVIQQGIKPIQDLIGEVTKDKGPALVQPITEFFTTINQAISSNFTTSSKTSIVSRADNIANTLSSAARIAYESQLNADTYLSSELTDVNSKLKQLFEINRQLIILTQNHDPVADLLDIRDKLLLEISTFFPIDYKFTSHNGINITSNSKTILSFEQYAQFSYDHSLAMEDMIDKGGKISPIYIKQFNYDGKAVASEKFYDPKNSPLPAKGAVAGYLELVSSTIPQYISALDTLTSNLTEQLNKLHNKGTGYPGVTSFTGTKEIAATDIAGWLGKATIAVVDENGRALKYGASDRVVNPLSLQLGKMALASPTGLVSTEEIITEINSHFYSAASPRMTMGQQGAEDKFLLEDFKLVVGSLRDDILDLDFEAANSSNFAAKIEILNVTGNLQNSLPDAANLEAGSKGRTFQRVNLAMTGLTGNQAINVTVRVVGANGIVQTGTLTFNVDLDNLPSRGSRINSTAAAGDVVARDPNYDRFAEAALVDASGNEISVGSGYLKIATTQGNYRLVVQDDSSKESSFHSSTSTGRGFSHYFGLNNLFNTTEKAGRYAYNLAVRDDILEDAKLFTTGLLGKANARTIELTEGSAAATTTVTFDNTPANIPGSYVGNTVTLNGITFTLVNVAVPGGVGAEQININGATTASHIIDAIIAKTSNHAALKNILTLSRNNEDLIITAKNKGTNGNNIQSQFRTGSGSNLYSLNNGGVWLGDTGMVNLAGGSDEITTKIRDGFGFELGEGGAEILSELDRLARNGSSLTGNDFIPSSVTTLRNFALSISTIVTNIFSSIDTNLTVARDALDTLKNNYDQNFAPNEDRSLQKIMEIQQWYRSLAKTIEINNKLFDVFIDAIR